MVTEDDSNHLLGVMDTLALIEETARGYRTSLIESGWTPEAAEKIAAELLITLNQKSFE